MNFEKSYFKFKLDFVEKHRIIQITGSIISPMLEQFRELMFYLQKRDDQEPIHLYIHSPGGEAYTLLGMLDVIDTVSNPVYTYVNGLAASAAAILLTYGDKRYATKYSTIMFHQPLAYNISGQTEDILIQAREMERLRNILADIVSEKTGLDKQYVLDELFDRDTYLDPQKALELKIIDEIKATKHKK